MNKNKDFSFTPVERELEKEERKNECKFESRWLLFKSSVFHNLSKQCMNMNIFLFKTD